MKGRRWKAATLFVLWSPGTGVRRRPPVARGRLKSEDGHAWHEGATLFAVTPKDVNPDAVTQAPDGASAAYQEVGPYRLVKLLGEGGFGHVLLAGQRGANTQRGGVKLVKPGMDSAEVLARFETERRALALMDHPHIARVLDAGLTKEGRPFLAMEEIGRAH